ncbi:MAG: FAD:protein FMN transferase [Treponema sp.]|nr:FAD:protein FMN transferase [Candidatus Treponema equi]
MKKSFNINRSICFASLLSALVLLIPGCEKNTHEPLSILCMDTVCSVNAFEYGTDELYKDITDRLLDLENKFSLTKADSEINRVNKNAGIMPLSVSSDFSKVMNVALKVSELTDGALDISAGPLINLWGINTDRAKVPSKEEIAEAIKKIDYKKIMVEGNSIFLTEKGMSINLGAVVKGYATDEVVSILKKHKAKRAIIDLGGNIYAFGRKEDHIPWIVGIKNPQNPAGEPLLKMMLKDNSVVTSGNYERYFMENGKRYHHIIDTKTGFPAESGYASVTITCKKSIVADCLSTAAFVMGEEKTKAVIPEMEKEFDSLIACIFIDKENNYSQFGKIKAEKYRK